jgi:hypothetical protein
LRQQLRLRQGLIITAQGGTPARITIITITVVVIMAATSRARGA